jgi:hypothetical protein
MGEVTRIETAFGLRVRFSLQLRQAELFAGVTHSNPYLTVGPGRQGAGRDGGTNGNMAVLQRATP